MPKAHAMCGDLVVRSPEPSPQSDLDIPDCAYNCLYDAVEQATDCVHEDFSCLCLPHNQQSVEAHSMSCVIASCGIDVAISESPQRCLGAR